jgi:hypothetical protein
VADSGTATTDGQIIQLIGCTNPINFSSSYIECDVTGNWAAINGATGFLFGNHGDTQFFPMIAPYYTSNGMTPIALSGQTSSVGSTNIGQATATSTFSLNANVTCDTSVSTATVTLACTYTDPSSTVQTLSPTAAACTTLGSSSGAFISQPIRVKTGTSIACSATAANSPNYDFSASAIQITPN